MTSMLAFARSTSAIAYVLVAIVTIGWILYYFANRRSAEPELGSEIELAANRKPYYDDETMEGKRLERFQFFGVLFLATITIGLPVYWILEPSRMAGAMEAKEQQFINWGSQLYATTEEGGFNCAGCHGANGGGGVASYTVTDTTTGEVKAVQWIAPAINNVLYRYDESELTFILVYGRPFSPMSPWGLAGGGPLNSQQIETIVSFIRSIQIPRENCGEGEDDPLSCASGELPQAERDRYQEALMADARKLVDAGKYDTVEAAMGEALFNSSYASGAYSCARCHTPGWSYGEPGVSGQGAFGWNLTGGSTVDHFPNETEMINFIKAGSEMGKRYGSQGQGSGRMPGFGNTLTDEQIKAVVEYVRSL